MPAGVVDQHIEATPALDGRGHGGFDGCAAADVGVDEEHRAALIVDRGGSRLAVLAINVSDDDVRSGSGQDFGAAAADAFGGAGDDGDAAGQVHQVHLLHLTF